MDALDRIYRAIPPIAVAGTVTAVAVLAWGRFYQAVGAAVCEASAALGTAEPCAPGEIPDPSTILGRGAAADGGAAPGAGNDNCFVAGTLVLTPLGPRPIETIHAGDWVLSREAPTSSVVPERVARTFVTVGQPVLNLRFEHGEALEVTPGHKFWTVDRGWVAAADLDAREMVASATEGADARVATVLPVSETATVYNLEVEQTHTYFVGPEGLWVHNPTDGCDGGAGRFVVRLQAQGGGLEKSETLNQSTPVTGRQALEGLVRLRGQLTKDELKDRNIALQKAANWITQATLGGGVGPPGKNGFTNPKVSANDARIDVEIKSGINLVPPL
jgi:hypothetical protein